MTVIARPGQMRHRVTVQEKVETKDPASGIISVTWEDKITDIPAAVRPLTSRELNAAAARQSQVSVEFEMRAGLDISASDRIVFEGKNWDIEPPTLDETRQRRMKIKASEGLTDG